MIKPELTSRDVAACAEALREYALNNFLNRPSARENFVKMWMGENRPNSGTTKAEMDLAVQLYFGVDPLSRRLEFVNPIR